MKHSRQLAIAFTGISVVLIILYAVFYFRIDRVKPEFKFTMNDLIYQTGMDTELLKQGITAIDRQDGDITDRIVIEKIVENKAGNSAVVFYAASDAAGNVAKISRVFLADFSDNAATQDETASVEGTDQGADTAEPPVQTEEAASEETNATEEIASKEAEEKAAEEAKAAEEEAKKAEEEAAKQDAAEEAKKAEEEKQKQADAEAARKRAEEEAQKAAGAPSIQLKASEVTTKVGMAPAWVEVIAALDDDEDSYETLFGNLSVSKYDMNTAGDYKVSLTTKDSKGHTSAPVTITVHVK